MKKKNESSPPPPPPPPWGLSISSNLSLFNEYKWAFVLVGFCPSGLLSSGLLSLWAFVPVGFCPTLKNWVGVKYIKIFSMTSVRFSLCRIFCPYKIFFIMVNLCSKVNGIQLFFLFTDKMLIIRAGSHKMLVGPDLDPNCFDLDPNCFDTLMVVKKIQHSKS